MEILYVFIWNMNENIRKKCMEMSPPSNNCKKYSTDSMWEESDM